MHDPKIYKDPFAFEPDRYLERGDWQTEPDPRTFAFGFGRR